MPTKSGIEQTVVARLCFLLRLSDELKSNVPFQLDRILNLVRRKFDGEKGMFQWYDVMELHTGFLCRHSFFKKAYFRKVLRDKEYLQCSSHHLFPYQ